MPQSVKPIEQQRLLEKTRKFLQTYRLVVEAGAIENYVKALSGLTEHEVDIGMDRANRENLTDFAPGPGVILGIIEEVRAGSRAGHVLAEMATWPESSPHPDWPEDEEWQKLKQRLSK